MAFRDCTNFHCFRTARTKNCGQKNFKSVGTRFLSQTLLSAATQPCTDFLNDIHYAMTLNTMLSGPRWHTVVSLWFEIIFEGVIPNQDGTELFTTYAKVHIFSEIWSYLPLRFEVWLPHSMRLNK